MITQAEVIKVPNNTGKMSFDYNTLVTQGSFSPASVLTAPVSKYQSFHRGWLLHYNINVYYGQWSSQVGQTPPAASYFNPSNVNVAAWANTAQSIGLDYAALTLINEYGFCIYPSEVAYNMSQTTLTAIAANSNHAITSPYYTDGYHVAPAYDQSIVSKFVTEFRARNIEPVAYIGLGADGNLAGASMWDASIPAARRELFIQYRCKIIQEVVQKFGFKYLWFDMADPALKTNNPGAIQRFYNAAKSIDPTVTIIGNVQGETDFSSYPYDIESTEEYAIYGGNTAYQTTSRTHGGNTYLIPQEIVATMWKDSYWYHVDATCPVQPTFTKLNPQPTSDFQEIINAAKTSKIPFIHDMMVDRNGLLLQAALDYTSARDFSFPFNVRAGQPNMIIAKGNKSFVELRINESNTSLIYKIGNPNQSAIPGNSLNSFDGFEDETPYYITSKKNLDLIEHSGPSTAQ